MAEVGMKKRNLRDFIKKKGKKKIKEFGLCLLSSQLLGRKEKKKDNIMVSRKLQSSKRFREEVRLVLQKQQEYVLIKEQMNHSHIVILLYFLMQYTKI